MDCNNSSINQLSSAAALTHDEIQGHEKLGEMQRMEMEIQDIKSKLLDCHIDSERTDSEILNVNHLKDKGTFVLKSIEKRYSDMNEELKRIHCNYVKCIKKAKFSDAAINDEVNSLSVEREKLKNEFEKLERDADENNKKLMEIKMKIKTQEKKNIALAKKLKNIMGVVRITPDLETRINAVFNDPKMNNATINTAQSNDI